MGWDYNPSAAFGDTSLYTREALNLFRLSPSAKSTFPNGEGKPLRRLRRHLPLHKGGYEPLPSSLRNDNSAFCISLMISDPTVIGFAAAYQTGFASFGFYSAVSAEVSSVDSVSSSASPLGATVKETTRESSEARRITFTPEALLC